MNKSNMIAEFFIAKAEIDRIEITNLKLQELLYCSQGMALAELGKTLFDEDIIVGDYGPEVSSVQKNTNKYTFNPIGIETPMEKLMRINKFDKGIEKILNDTWNLFGRENVWELSEIIFQQIPWQKAIKRKDKIINKEELKNCFKELLNEILHSEK